MRLVAAGSTERSIVHCRCIRGIPRRIIVHGAIVIFRPCVILRTVLIAGRRGSKRKMHVRWHLRRVQRHRFLSADLTQDVV